MSCARVRASMRVRTCTCTCTGRVRLERSHSPRCATRPPTHKAEQHVQFPLDRPQLPHDPPPPPPPQHARNSARPPSWRRTPLMCTYMHAQVVAPEPRHTTRAPTPTVPPTVPLGSRCRPAPPLPPTPPACRPGDWLVGRLVGWCVGLQQKEHSHHQKRAGVHMYTRGWASKAPPPTGLPPPKGRSRLCCRQLRYRQLPRQPSAAAHAKHAIDKLASNECGTTRCMHAGAHALRCSSLAGACPSAAPSPPHTHRPTCLVGRGGGGQVDLGAAGHAHQLARLQHALRPGTMAASSRIGGGSAFAAVRVYRSRQGGAGRACKRGAEV